MNVKMRNSLPAVRSRRLPLVLTTLAIMLFTIAVALPHKDYILSRYLQRLSSCLCLSYHFPDDTHSPALKNDIKQYIIQAMEAHMRGEWDYVHKANGSHVALQVMSGYHGLFAPRSDDPSVVIDGSTEAPKCWTVPPLLSQLGICLPHLICPSHIHIEHSCDTPAAIGQAP